LAKFCERVAVSYPEAERYFPAKQVVLTGNPLREDITAGDANRAREKFNLADSKKTIFISGGSQGARSINEHILNILPKLLADYQIIHQTGEKNLKEVEDKAGVLGIKAGREGYYPIGFIGEDLKDIYAVADLVIIRAGANTIAETAANGKPAIIIPLGNSANNHQQMNAFSRSVPLSFKRPSPSASILTQARMGRAVLFVTPRPTTARAFSRLARATVALSTCFGVVIRSPPVVVRQTWGFALRAVAA